ncbi:hypothetical protein KTN05_06255 [Paracoccus sp. Z118]|uniref:hypothetical protein n=1 Tax=Paracoccus sp. Z118 TaxID=2851017 RepID=UPI001C2BC6CB|nr:hypothetical protein [Paracoccus sp. Z118]MBV0891456.1 hypothetical protein [Paracoccus sp. Z118]
MANASSKKFGAGQQDQGKGDGSGGMSPLEPDATLPSEALSNRDTSRHSEQRGLDSRHVKNEQGHEHVASHAPGAGAAGDVDREKLADERPASSPPASGTRENEQ